MSTASPADYRRGLRLTSFRGQNMIIHMAMNLSTILTAISLTMTPIGSENKKNTSKEENRSKLKQNRFYTNTYLHNFYIKQHI